MGGGEVGRGAGGGGGGGEIAGGERDTLPTERVGGGRRSAVVRGGERTPPRDAPRRISWPCLDRASAFDPALEAGLSRIRHGSAMTEPVSDKAEGWREWLEKYQLWEGGRPEEANYLRYC